MKLLGKLLIVISLLLATYSQTAGQLLSNTGTLTVGLSDCVSANDGSGYWYYGNVITVTPNTPIKIKYTFNTYDNISIYTIDNGNVNAFVESSQPTNSEKSVTVISTTGKIYVYGSYGWGWDDNVIFTLNYSVDTNYAISNDLYSKGNSIIAGNLGVGASSPREKLDVIGNSIISGKIAIGGIYTPQTLNVYGNSYLTGNLNLGTQGDGSKLAVNGDVHIGILNNGNFSYGNKLAFMGADDSGWDPLWMARYSESQDHTQLRMNIGDNSSGDDKFIVGNVVSGDVTKTWNPHFTVQNNDKVGIGTATPKARLDIASDITNQFGAIFGRLPDGNADGTFLGVKGYSTQPINSKSFAIEHYFLGKANSSINFLRGGTDYDGILTFNAGNNVERMRIQNTGQVSIGTPDLDLTPNVMLTVKGSIHTKEVIIDANSPLADFVFKPTYKLMPLHEVEQYVNKNSHLPEIPSAREVEKNGMNMGEMQNLLLQKVEELTLYMIQLKKENEVMKAQINAISKQ